MLGALALFLALLVAVTAVMDEPLRRRMERDLNEREDTLASGTPLLGPRFRGDGDLPLGADRNLVDVDHLAAEPTGDDEEDEADGREDDRERRLRSACRTKPEVEPPRRDSRPGASSRSVARARRGARGRRSGREPPRRDTDQAPEIV